MRCYIYILRPFSILLTTMTEMQTSTKYHVTSGDDDDDNLKPYYEPYTRNVHLRYYTT